MSAIRFTLPSPRPVVAPATAALPSTPPSLLRSATVSSPIDVALSRNPQGVDFLVSSMNWLLNRNQFTGVMPKTVQHFPLNLTERQLSSIALRFSLFPVWLRSWASWPGGAVGHEQAHHHPVGWLALAAIIFLAIYEPLTRSTRENDITARDGAVLQLDPSRVRKSAFPPPTARPFSSVAATATARLQVKDRADVGVVNRLLQAAAGLEFFDRIDAREVRNDKDMSDYGLRRRSARSSSRSDGTITLLFGKDAANEKRLYVRTDKSRDIYLVSDELLNLAFGEASSFRDRRLTDLGPDQVDRFVIRRAGGEIELVRDATGWRVVKPIHTLADAQKVDDYLGSSSTYTSSNTSARTPATSASTASPKARTKSPSSPTAANATDSPPRHR